MKRFVLASLFTLALSMVAAPVAAQQPAPTAPPPAPPAPYGEPIGLEAAMKVLAAAKAEAEANSWPVAIAVVDGGGHLVAFQRLDNTQYGSVNVALEKAKTSALFRRPTKAFEDVLAAGGAGLRILSLPGATPLEGGLPIVIDGKVIGAVGVSGVQSFQDAQIAAAGLKSLEQ